MALFKQKKKSSDDFLDSPAPPMGSPIEQVNSMKQQGYTNNQIIQTLQSQGYGTNQIFDIINQAAMQNPMPVQEQEPSQEYGYEPSYQQPSYPSYQPQPSSSGVTEERIQELTEAIIDEKWEDFTKDVKKMIEWKEKTEDRLAKLEQQMIDLRLSVDSLTKGMMAKIASYDQNITDVGVEIKAMEKVFQKVLPSLTENINKLDRMTKDYKEPVRK